MESIGQSSTDRDVLEGSTDTRGATLRTLETPKLDKIVLQNLLQSREVRTECNEKAEPHTLQQWEYVRKGLLPYQFVWGLSLAELNMKVSPKVLDVLNKSSFAS